MPCRDDWNTSYDSAQRINALDAATRAACELYTRFELAVQKIDGMASYYNTLSSETLAWIVNHKEMDQRRKDREREMARVASVKQAALDKLTEEEKAILGL